MTIEQMIQAKIQMAQTDAIWGMVGGGAFLIIGLLLAWWGWRRRDDDVAIPTMLIGGVIALMAATILIGNTYYYATAEIKARAEMANYSLQQINFKVYNDNK
jgi:peptidoglycan/LPS O-acetylase OafA/YrhL